MRTLALALGLAACGVLWEANGASGQEATSAGEPASPAASEGGENTSGPKSRVVEEIVVTAQKREENLQDVPLSVSAFSDTKMDALGIDDPKDLAQYTPGMFYGQLVNFSIIYIRGVGTDAFLPDSDPSVATYIDGIYYPFANGQSQAFGAVDRVEVLKGPQGTLFGRNSTGGAINIITKDPGDEIEASTLVSFARFNDFKSRFYLSGPVAGGVSVGASVIYNVSDNYYSGSRGDGAGGQERLPQEEAKGVRAKIRFEPFDWVDLTAATLIYRYDGLASTAMPNVAPSRVLRLQGGMAETRDYRVNVDVPSFFKNDSNVYYGTLQLHPEWFDVKLLGAYQDITTDNNYDFDGTTTPFITFDARGQFSDVKSGEFQILSNGEWGWDWLEWIVGAYYLDQSQGFPLNRLSAGSLDLSDGSFAGVPLPAGFYNTLIQVSGATGVPLTDGFSIALRSLQDTSSYAFYTQETVTLFDSLHLTAGVRYQQEKREVIESSISAVNVDGSLTPVRQFSTPTKESSNFSPKFVVGYDLFDETLVYASYTKGFKSGTFNTVNVYDEPEYVKPEVVETIELGAKTTFFDGNVRANAALFRNDITNLQVQFVSLLAGGAVRLENAGGAEIYGADWDFLVTPLPALDPGLAVTIGGCYLHSKYTDYTNGSGFSEPDGVQFSDGDFTGNEVTHTPEFSGNLGVNQVLQVWRGEIELGTSFYYNSGFFYLAQNSDVSKEDSYVVLDAEVSYLYEPWNVRLTVFGKNLTDSRYTFTQFHTDSGRQDYLAPPLVAGGRIGWDF